VYHSYTSWNCAVYGLFSRTSESGLLKWSSVAPGSR